MNEHVEDTNAILEEQSRQGAGEDLGSMSMMALEGAHAASEMVNPARHARIGAELRRRYRKEELQDLRLESARS